MTHLVSLTLCSPSQKPSPPLSMIWPWKIKENTPVHSIYFSVHPYFLSVTGSKPVYRDRGWELWGKKTELRRKEKHWGLFSLLGTTWYVSEGTLKGQFRALESLYIISFQGSWLALNTLREISFSSTSSHSVRRTYNFCRFLGISQ